MFQFPRAGAYSGGFLGLVHKTAEEIHHTCVFRTIFQNEHFDHFEKTYQMFEESLTFQVPGKRKMPSYIDVQIL